MLRVSRVLALSFVCWMSVVNDGKAQPLDFAPYEFVTNAHGTHAAEVAFLTVPRRHADPGGPTFRLRVVRLRAEPGPAGGPPIVYLAGGPGGSGVGSARGARWPTFARMRRVADVLLLDQRGTGLSEPAPECPYEADLAVVGREPFLAELRKTATRCVAYWREQHVDLDAYSTVESAHDVDALRQALGVGQLRLWAMSYGTHLASSVLRLHESGVARAVLMGYEGPDDTLKRPLAADTALREWAALAAIELRLPDTYRDLVGNTTRLLAQLEHTALRASVLSPSARPREQIIGRFEASLAIAGALGSREAGRWLPMAVGRALDGNADVLAELVYVVKQRMGTSHAMSLAMDVASGASATRLERIDEEERQSLFGDALNFPLPDLAVGLGIADLGDEFRMPVVSAVPALFIAGTLDARTPVANVDAALPGFSQASRVTIDGAAHDDDLWLAHPDIGTRIEAFFSDQWRGDERLQGAPVDFARSMVAELFVMAVASVGWPGLGLVLLLATAATGGATVWWRRRRRRRALPVGSRDVSP